MTFKLNPDANTNGTSLRGYVILKPFLLVEKFGYPESLDDFKVSGTYSFDTPAGNVITLYDWKSTTLYHCDDGETPTPEELWTSKKDFEFNIGGNCTAEETEAFQNWIKAQLSNSMRFINNHF